MKWIKSPWTISFVTAIFSLILTIIYDYFKQNPFLSTIIEVVKWIGNKIIFILNYDIKVWWILSSIITIVILILFINLRREKIIKPDFYNYKEDKFKKWKWSWDWEYNRIKGGWDVKRMQPYCPHCDTPLIKNSSLYILEYWCPRCEYNATSDDCDDPVNVKVIIFDNVNRKRKNNKLNNSI